MYVGILFFNTLHFFINHRLKCFVTTDMIVPYVSKNPLALSVLPDPLHPARKEQTKSKNHVVNLIENNSFYIPGKLSTLRTE